MPARRDRRTGDHDYLRSIGVRPVAYGDDYGHYEAVAAALGVPAGTVRTSEDRRVVEVAHWSAGPDPRLGVQLLDVAELVAEWNLRVLVSGYSPFANLVEALTDLDARHSRGVVVVGMRPSAPAREYLRPKLRTRYEETLAAS